MASDRLTRVTGLIRTAGIFVIFLLALPGMSQDVAGLVRWSYFIEQCASDSDMDAGQPCGAQIPGCARTGTIECRSSAMCGEGQENKTCGMEEIET